MLKKYFFIFVSLFVFCNISCTYAAGITFSRGDRPYNGIITCESEKCTVSIHYTGSENNQPASFYASTTYINSIKERVDNGLIFNKELSFTKDSPGNKITFSIDNLTPATTYGFRFSPFYKNGTTPLIFFQTEDWWPVKDFSFTSNQVKYSTYNTTEPVIEKKILVQKPEKYVNYKAFNNPQKGFKVKLEYIKEKQGVTDAEKFPSDGVMTVPASKDRAGKDIGINDDGTYYFALRALSPNTNYAIRETITPPVGDQKITVDSFNTGREYTPPNSIEEQKQFDLRSYRLLAPLPGINMILNPDLCAEQRAQGRKIEICSVDEFISFGIKFLIGLSAVFLVLRLMIDGYNIITTDVPFLKVSAQSDFKTSLGGLFLVLCSYLILNTINPRLVQNNLSIEKVTLTSKMEELDGEGEAFINGKSQKIKTISVKYSKDFSSGTACAGTGGTSQKPNNATCTAYPSTIQKSASGAFGEKTFVEKITVLQSRLAAKNIQWRITEAWPPSREHKAFCHQIGTCIDMNHTTTPSIDQIKTVIEEASALQMCAKYEILNDSNLYNSLLKVGLNNNVLLFNKWISATHYSLYNGSCK